MDNHNKLVDDETNFILPLMLVGVVFIVALLAFGLFMPTPDWIF